MMKKKLTGISLLCLCTIICSGQRISRTINESWNFSIAGSNTSRTVNIPHTWNNIDCQDETPGYFRGRGEYRKTVHIEETTDDHCFFLHFEGANQTTEVFVNGQPAGTHQGGYTAFCFDVTDLVQTGDNIIRVIVDNSHNPDIPPLSADFTFFGGIYRDVSLVITPKVHISATHYATSGVYVKTSDEDKETASANITTYLCNATESDRTVILSHTVTAPDGSAIARSHKKVKIEAGAENCRDNSEIKIDDPQLWNIGEPNLYRIVTTVSDIKSDSYDIVSDSFGIRWFEFDPEEGFSINGKYTKLTGTNRHQDYYLQGNALNDEMHVRDIRLLKEMGGNFLRIAHYPQDPVITQMCDRYGIVASVEIPVVNAVTMSEEFRQNCLEMTREMIWQDYNSPSVAIWAYMNEVLLRPPYDKNDNAEKKAYMDYLYSLAADIESTIKSLDPERYSMIPCHSNSKIYDECGISRLPDILGWNLYNGWYSNGFEGFGRTLDRLHETYPGQSLIVTEYGADVDPRLHSFDSERFDFTCEYGLKYHSHYIPEIMKRKWLAGSAIWNLNDFYSEGRLDAVPRVNNKGITGIDRERKDSYNLYKAWLSDKPELVIGGHDWKIRGGCGDSTGRCVQPVEVYSNAAEVELILNGNSLGTEKVKNMTATFAVPFTDGPNTLEAVATKDGSSIRDILRTDFRMIPYRFDSGSPEFHELNVMLGSKRFFEDRKAEMIWIPEQEYRKGSWGYVGGYAARTKTGHGSLPCSDADIINTDMDPVYQTQRRNLERFRADVPDGQYYVYLHFAELVSGEKKEALAYNLGNDAAGEEKHDRTFDVEINGTTVMKNFDISSECGTETAVIRKMTVDVINGSGIDIRFIPVKGEPVLNAVRIYRCF